MSEANRLAYLRIALVVIGLTFIFGIYPLAQVWPSGWTWGPGALCSGDAQSATSPAGWLLGREYSHYFVMILGVYATLGVFLLLAARDPFAYASVIWFTVWSSVVHAGIMLVQSMADASERGHLIGDVPALVLIAIVLAGLSPRSMRQSPTLAAA